MEYQDFHRGTSLETKTFLQAKVHRGHKITELNRAMAPYIYGERHGRHIINVEYSAAMIHRASQLIGEVFKQKGHILCVSTRPRINFLNKSLMPQSPQVHMVTRRWIPGTLTNWDTVYHFMHYFEHKMYLEEKNVANFGIKKSQKKRFRRHFTRLRNLTEKPDLLLIFHSREHPVALREAKICQVPRIAIVDSDGDPTKVDFPIPGNDDGLYAQYLYRRLLWQHVPKNNSLIPISPIFFKDF